MERPLRDPGPIPARLPVVWNGTRREAYEFVILGAGCAGLSLCHYLLEEGVDAPILILDRRSSFEDDRTWCFWDVEPTPFSRLALKSWRSWSAAADGRRVTQTTRRYPYLCITGRDFYEDVLARLARHANVTLRLGEGIAGYREESKVTLVETSGGTYRARHVFDGRGLARGEPRFEEARRNGTWVPQKFLGRRVWSLRPVFDPDRVTLMDFGVDQSRGLRFAYVLPFSEREALVESVYLSEAAAGPETYRTEIGDYLEEAYGLGAHEYDVLGEERGYIPMTDHRFPRRVGERAYAIGMLGGETRPSTGYTFLRIQRYCRALAAAVARGGTPPEQTGPKRLKLLDGLFVRFLRERPADCPSLYLRMFAGVAPDSLVRFLTEKSTPLDEARLIGALPKTPFLKLAAKTLFEAPTLRD